MGSINWGNFVLSFLLLSAVVANAQKTKVIFDCDLASDIDDAYALALLLSSQDEIDLLGIVMDHGLTRDRALVAGKMLDMTGQAHIPVYIGRETEKKLFNDLPNNKAPYERQMYWAKDYQSADIQEQSGVDFIRESLEKYPGEVVLVTVGPVPNIGDLLREDPEILKKAKSVVSMFGSFYTGYGGIKKPSAEYNVREDLESSQMMARSGADIVYLGLDVTDHVKLAEMQTVQLFMRQTPLTDAVSALYALWRGEWGDEWTVPTLFDVVAIGYILWPDLFEVQSMHVDVDDEGYTKIIEGMEPNAQVAIEIDDKEFVRRFMASLLTQNLGQN